jgi:hypothetical protein
MSEQQEKEENEKGKSWLAYLLIVLAIFSTMYAFSGFMDEYPESRIEYGFSSAITLIVVAQILTYLQELVNYAERRDRRESNP